jgi:hypothetical protein
MIRFTGTWLALSTARHFMRRGKVEMAREPEHSPPQRTSGTCLPDIGWGTLCQSQNITAKQQNEVTSSVRKLLFSGTVRCFLNESVLVYPKWF